MNQIEVRRPTRSGELTKIVKGRDDSVPRRLRTKKVDLEDSGSRHDAQHAEQRTEDQRREAAAKSAESESRRSSTKLGNGITRESQRRFALTEEELANYRGDVRKKGAVAAGTGELTRRHRPAGDRGTVKVEICGLSWG